MLMLGCVQVRNLVKPITSLKKLQVSLTLAPGLPPIVVGDDKRLMQTALNVVGNAVKFTKEGSISIKVCLERPEHTVDPLVPEFHPMQGEQHCYIRVEVPFLWLSFLGGPFVVIFMFHSFNLEFLSILLDVCSRIATF
jgi:signal transduction histidine kinase